MSLNKDEISKLIELGDDKSESEVISIIKENPHEACVVGIRCKHTGEHKWEYLADSCDVFHQFGRDELVWLSDWYEGQADVEYLWVLIVNQIYKVD